jgi:hypothetical protein
MDEFGNPAVQGRTDGYGKQAVSASATTPLLGESASTAHASHQGDFVTLNEHRDLARGLHQRHISLIAIAGAIGTGLFLGLGSAVQTGGPLGALLGYATVGLVVCAVQFALGEVTALLPVTGSFVRHAEFLVDPALGFAIGWNIVCALRPTLSPLPVFFPYTDHTHKLSRYMETGSPYQPRSQPYAFCSSSGPTSTQPYGSASRSCSRSW